jgi:tetratricopeptide (TPR) repeat protein
MKSSKKEAATSSDVWSSRWAFWVVTFCALLVIIHCITSFFPHIRVWGVNQLAYFPLYIRVILAVISFSIFIPQVNRGIRAIAKKLFLFFSEKISKHKPYLWYAVFSLIGMVLFWIFRSRTYFLGDGSNYVSNLNTGVKTLIWSELLESILHVQLYRFLNLYFSADGQLAYQIASIVAGAIFVFLVFLFSEYLGRDLFEKVFVFTILVIMGSVELFFGYVEHYSYVLIATLSYLLFSLKWIENRGKIVIPVLLFLLSVVFHFSSFFLLPSLVYLLLLTGSRGITPKKVLIIGGGAFLALLLVSIYVYTSKPLIIRIFVLPFEGKFTTSGYTSFSFAHLLDILNELLLLAPAGVILILVTLLVAFKKTEVKSPRIFFLLLVAGFGFIYHFTFDPLLGAGRDWDMFAITSAGYSILGICLFLKANANPKSFKYASVILVWTSFVSLIPWVALNINETKSVQRFRDLLELDPQKSRSGRFFLMNYFEKEGMINEAQKEDLRQKELFPAYFLALEARKYYDQGMPDTALVMLRKAVELDPFFSEIHYHLARILYLQGNLDSAEIEYKLALKLKPEHIGAYVDLAQIYVQRQLWDKALKQYNMVLKFRVELPGVYNNIGGIYLRKNRIDEAIEYFKKALKLQDDYVLSHFGLGRAFSRRGQMDEAIREFEKAIQLEPDYPDAYFFIGYLFRDMGQNDKAKASWEQFLKLSKDPLQSGIIRNALDSLSNP